jgi:hypothetical protein
MGYWLVILMATCAVAAVVLALAGERSLEPSAVLPRSSGSLRWLAVVGRGNGAAADWPASLRAVLPADVDGRIVAADGQTLQAVDPVVRRALADGNAEVVVFWVALADFLAGEALADHERALHDLLEWVRSRSVVPVVGGLPDLTTWTVADEAGLPRDELAGVVARWNAAIGRLVHASGGLPAELFELGEAELDEAEAIARCILPSLRRALILAHRRSAPAAPIPL